LRPQLRLGPLRRGRSRQPRSCGSRPPPAGRHEAEVIFFRLSGAIRLRFGCFGRKAGGPAALVAKLSAPLGWAQPATEQAVGGVEDVLGGKANLRGVALDCLDRVALGVGVAALVLQRAQDLRQLGEAEDVFDGDCRRAATLTRARAGRKQPYPVPVIGFVSSDIETHREQFILVNKAKPLPTRLINELLPELSTLLPRDLAVRSV
jgi:hypothetical protein